ncbi:hypothetical protein VTO42DRAFT_4532 [Malbranchea cinnamomea]
MRDIDPSSHWPLVVATPPERRNMITQYNGGSPSPLLRLHTRLDDKNYRCCSVTLGFQTCIPVTSLVLILGAKTPVSRTITEPH